MRTFHVVVAVVLGLVVGACAEDEKVDPQVKETLVKLREARDQGCACTNLECIKRVQTDLNQWIGNGDRLMALSTKASKRQNAEGRRLADELVTCASKLEGSGGGN